MPAAPLVGAVTMRPPDAFCSLTAMAARLSQSIAWAGSPGAPQAFVDRRRPARRTRRRAGEGAAGAAARVDALPHDPPDLHQPGAHLGLVADDGLVGEHQLGDRRARWSRSGRAARRRSRRGSGGACVGLRVSVLVVGEHEAAADRVVRLLRDHRALGVDGGEPQRVGVAGVDDAGEQRDGVVVEGDGVPAREQHLAVGADLPRCGRTACSGSTVSGRWPSSPRTTASGVPWPMPVAPSEP